jgi:hypothetical protein
MIKHKDWDINEESKGFDGEGKPIIGVTFQNGLNDIEPDGSFVPCDINIEEAVIGVTTHKVKRGRYGELRFSDAASPNKHLCKIKDKNSNGRSIKYIDADSDLPDVANGKPKFVASNGISIEHTPMYNGVKIELVVDDTLTAPIEYTFSVKDYGQAYTDELIDGAIVSTGEDGKKVTFHAPYAEDANGDIGQVYYILLGKVDGYSRFKKVVDEAWLRSATAPVRIDPNVTIEDGVGGGVIVESMMNAGVVNANYGARVNMNCTDYTPTRVNWAIRTVLTGHGIGTVTLAEYRLNCDQITGGGGFNCNLWPILRQWNEGTQNGAGEVGSICAAAARFSQENWTTNNARNAGTDYDNTTATGSFTAPVGTGAYTITLDNSIIQARVDGGTDYGDVCHNVTDTSSKSFRTETSESGNKPQLYIEYTEGGIQILRRRIEGY